MSANEEISTVTPEPRPTGVQQQEISTVTPEPRTTGVQQQGGMSANEDIFTITPELRPVGAQRQHDTITKPSIRGRRTLLVGVVTMMVLTAGLILHTFCLATPNLANLQTTTAYSRFYKFPFAHPPTSDINMGLWKMCSNAWHFDCVDWASSTELNKNTSTIISIKKPDWLIVAQNTGVSGLAVAALTDFMIFINLCIHVHKSGKICRLFPVINCVGALIAGGLVFTSCAFVVTNYDSIANRVARLEKIANSNDDLMIKTSSSMEWGYYLDAASAIVMWVASLLILCNHRGVGKTWSRGN